MFEKKKSFDSTMDFKRCTLTVSGILSFRDSCYIDGSRRGNVIRGKDKIKTVTSIDRNSAPLIRETLCIYDDVCADVRDWKKILPAGFAHR